MKKAEKEVKMTKKKMAEKLIMKKSMKLLIDHLPKFPNNSFVFLAEIFSEKKETKMVLILEMKKKKLFLFVIFVVVVEIVEISII